VPRKQASKAKEQSKPLPADTGGQSSVRDAVPANHETASVQVKVRKNGGWREIEARREKAALKASLADVWDEDFDLDDEILADLDHTAEYFTQQEDAEEEVFVDDDDDDGDEYYDDEEV
jgi:hypothetical protein